MMTYRERWLAAARLEPVDRLPFWPKLGAGYREARRPPFSDMDLNAMRDWMDSDRQFGVGMPLRMVHRNCSAQTHGGNGVRTTVYSTPHGSLRAELTYAPMSHSWHPSGFPVATVDDIRILKEWYDDIDVELDRDELETLRARRKAIGETGATFGSIGTSALMEWVQRLASFEDAQVLLAEHPGEVEALFDSIHRVLRRRVEIACEYAPADMLYLTENTSTHLISPRQYRRLNFPHMLEYAQIAQQAGRLMILHMCGHLKAILSDLAKLPVCGFETFTSPPVGDTPLIDGRTACPNICLIGGTNANLWTKPAHAIIETLERDLDALPHHRGLIITSAGVMPPCAEPETVKTVCEWVHAYQPNMAASAR